MKTITLTNNTEVVATVDDEDYERLNAFKWLLSPKGYIIRYEGPSDARIQYRMHNQVLGIASGSGVDHIDGMKWNNMKYNLRVVSASTNCQNKQSGRNSSGYKGVYFDKKRGKYKAAIGFNGRQITLGHFNTAEEAGDRYDNEAIQLYGSDALTNKKIRNGG